jgi:uncharacterized protein (DUF362 family)
MQAQQTARRDTVIAGATVQRTPRVGVVLSSYKGGGDHFGNAKFAGVAEPRPSGDELSDAQLRALTRRAVELGNHPTASLRRIVARGDAVLLLVNRYAEPAVVSAVIELVNDAAPGSAITILSENPARFSGAKLVDVSAAESARMPAPGIWSRRDVTYRVPKAVLECDKLISITPLKIENGRPSLTLDNYRSITSKDDVASGSPDVVAMDLFGFHPAEYAVLGGTHVLRNGGRVRHNLVLAGPIASAVDAVGASVLGAKPQELPILQAAGKRGFGAPDIDLIWTLGNEIEEARLAR